MTTRRGPNSFMDGNLPLHATLSPEVLRSTFRGLMALREVELNGTHRLIFGPKSPCSAPNFLSDAPTGPVALEAYQNGFRSDCGEVGVRARRVQKAWATLPDIFG